MVTKFGLVGVGLIGGSFALSLKQRYRSLKIMGWDISEGNLAKAKELGIIDEISDLNGISSCECCMVATPVQTIAKYVIEIGKLNPNAVVFDVGSVKKPIVDSVLKSNVNVKYIPFHPIAGTENFGPEAAFAGLFDNAYGIITPYEGIDQKALGLVERIVSDLNMKVKFLSPDLHDKVFGYVSHLPHVVAYALVNLISDKPEEFRFVGGGFRDYTRVAASSEQMWADIFTLNKENVSKAIDEYIDELTKVKQLIDEERVDELKERLKKARLFKRSLDG